MAEVEEKRKPIRESRKGTHGSQRRGWREKMPSLIPRGLPAFSLSSLRSFAAYPHPKSLVAAPKTSILPLNMAWRIQDSVQRGEIDNRERGLIRGRVWMEGVADPVILELKGNACPDLAGCLLEFKNSGSTLAMPPEDQIAPLQQGTAGDMTVSKKVRVLDMPIEEAYERKEKGQSVPEHVANCLYIEWFSQASGRVVIESVDYKLTISQPEWRLSPEEEASRQKDAAAGFSGFLTKFSDAVAAATHQPKPGKEWDEFDYEKLLRETDARTEKYRELMDKYQDHPDQEKIVAREMGWEPLIGEVDELDEEELEEAEEIVFDDEDDFPPLEPDAATEGVDWVRDEEGEIYHPLSLRACMASSDLWKKYVEGGFDKSIDRDISSFFEEFETMAVKLGGALDGLAYGRNADENAFIVAQLKRALHHLHATQAALERTSLKNLLPRTLLDPARKELFVIREEILKWMEEFRK